MKCLNPLRLARSAGKGTVRAVFLPTYILDMRPVGDPQLRKVTVKLKG